MKLHLAESEAFRANLSAWLDEHQPSTETMAAEPALSTGHIPGWARAWQRRLFDHGWLVPGWPPELGGRNASAFEQMVYFEEFARRQLPRTTCPQTLSIIGPSIIDYGSDEQREQYALPALRGEKSGCLGMSEPGAGSDLAGLQTRADLDGDHFLVNGQKVWTSGAAHADFCFCLVRTDREAIKHKGISVLLIDMDTPGITVRPLAQIDDPRHADFNEVFFEDVAVPRSKLVGSLHGGWAVATGSLSHERKMVWVIDSTANQRRMQATIDLLAQRPRVDPPVADWLAHLYIDVQALRLIGYRSVAKLARGVDSSEHSVLKLFGSETGRDMYLLVVEALGAAALRVDDRFDTDPQAPLDQSPELAYLRSFGGTIYGGTSEIQRNVIAERVLGLPRR
jgi:alkylation response protein AidB-like acyl-CoA dehydrogenase